MGWTLAELDDRTVVCQHCRAKAQSLRKPGFVRASPTGDRIESYVQARLADQHDVYGWSASGGVAVILAALGVDRGSFPKRIDGVYLLVLGVLEPEPHKGQARRA